jgi:hypothetical protein
MILAEAKAVQNMPIATPAHSVSAPPGAPIAPGRGAYTSASNGHLLDRHLLRIYFVPLLARSREHRRARWRIERTRTTPYRPNAARVAAAVALKYPGGSMKPHSLNAEPLVRARR